ncbi:carboxylesterase/lipase family protein [Novosphingobium sp. P6W]|uniref:carboxylesterase/lipase family protein n=1 Tax=Novosphingobium sp. P6W TaxID=1609758 RepID=UPI0005C3138D|nr:carboxylesterase family protein [Novosphingobium sp. P6W]AXB79554.1 carboxylesterase/lipase family protein [Novosphingobium sp. P6W]KIS34297.1 carboxylesterase [Novosphingobium sp. P6W]
MSGTDAGITRRTLVKSAAVLATAAPAPLLARSPKLPRVGRYAGLVEDGVLAFKGIRYGRAARFVRAVAEPWDGHALAADKFGPICPQRAMGEEPQSEDCLFLNVWTPEANPRAGRAVMVYFHGGAYTTGSVTDPLTHGAKLAADGDVVVVTVNHRLNALGYAWLKPFGARYADSGNLGQLDLILALQWVADHIAAFGGDPARIMVFGQSGGGAKIATLMAMPAAKGLFHSAATMSGQQVQASGPAHAWSRTLALMAALKLAPGDVDGLRTMPVERLMDGLDASDPIMSGGIYFGPVLDMTNLPRHPFWPDAAQQSLAIPMILGNVREETRAFLNPRGPKLQGLSWENIAARILPEIKIDLDPVWVVEQYRSHEPNWSPEQIYYAATTDGRSWPGQVIEADERAAAGASATWVYQFDRPSPVDPLRGAAHTDDIPYVFGTLAAPGSFSGVDQAARKLSAAMMRAFTGLAKTGRPGLPEWSAYRLPGRATMMFDDTVRVENDPRRWQRELWATAPYVQPGT